MPCGVWSASLGNWSQGTLDPLPQHKQACKVPQPTRLLTRTLIPARKCQFRRSVGAELWRNLVCTHQRKHFGRDWKTELLHKQLEVQAASLSLALPGAWFPQFPRFPCVCKFPDVLWLCLRVSTTTSVHSGSPQAIVVRLVFARKLFLQ